MLFWLWVRSFQVCLFKASRCLLLLFANPNRPEAGLVFVFSVAPVGHVALPVSAAPRLALCLAVARRAFGGGCAGAPCHRHAAVSATASMFGLDGAKIVINRVKFPLFTHENSFCSIIYSIIPFRHGFVKRWRGLPVASGCIEKNIGKNPVDCRCIRGVTLLWR